MKDLLRSKAIKLRDSLTPDQIHSKSIKIIDKLINLEQFKTSKTIMCYINIRSEVVTESFINKCLENHKIVAVPYINFFEESEMIASQIFDIKNNVEIVKYGIIQPKKNMVREIDPKKIDLIVVPGVAFDEGRNRLGYGKGYFDRFLSKVSNNCLKIGIAFEIQIFERIPVQKHDISMDIVITEDRNI